MKKKNSLLDMDSGCIALEFSRNFPEITRMARESDSAFDFCRMVTGYANLIHVPDQDGDAVREAASRIAEMAGYEGRQVTDLSTGQRVALNTFGLLRQALRGENTKAGADFMADMYHLFAVLNGHVITPPTLEKVKGYARRWEYGTQEEVMQARQRNRERIIGLLVERIEGRSAAQHKRYCFPEGTTDEQKRELVDEWWNDFRFHLVMAIRSPRELNKYLGYSLNAATMDTLMKARHKEMPFFLTPYYASLLDVTGTAYDDRTIRSYVIYSSELVEAYGGISAWEKEDVVEADKPNAAGWVLPDGRNIHRRYPEVAILIPDSMGRACAGLCAPCQRMYDFQNRRLSFEFNDLRPNEHWDTKLRRLMRYFEYDSDLRDILITGGDALMSQNKTLRNILEAVLRMAARKRDANRFLPEGEKRATIDRVRLGTRIPVYLPMRVNDELIEILSEFSRLGRELGIRQFFIQTHFESPLEITPESRLAISKLLSAGWLVTNQLVFTVAASRRGHTARLRQMLSREGVVCYYTFSVKGFGENYALFAPNSRSLQEQAEEKSYGLMTPEQEEELMFLLERPDKLRSTLPMFLKRHNLPFISTDRNLLNLPGIGKSMTFTTVGITAAGRRVLKFEHDRHRRHSPVIEQMGEIYITENKSLAAYLRQLRDIGERPADYASIWQYGHGVTEPRFRIFDYPGGE